MGALANVLIVAYLLIVVALIGVILLQRSEGGGLGMGSANSNGLVSVRGTANLLTRTTAILAALFFASAIGLTILTELDRGTSTIVERAVQGTDAPATVLDALEQMQQQTSGSDLPVPADTTAPAATDGAATTTAPAAGTTAPAETTAPTSDLPVPAETAPATTEQPAAPAN